MSHNTKTKAKRMGVKSVFAYGDCELAVTSFGKGNRAELVLRTDAKGSDLHLPQRFTPSNISVREIGDEIDLERGALCALVDNPAEDVPEDYLHLKATLEQAFFGAEFPNDNVHIQIIHNILDVLKILGLYINDILYCVSNLQSKETPEEFLGQSLNKKDETKLLDILISIKPYMGFLGAGFKVAPPRDKTKKAKVNFLKRAAAEALIQAESDPSKQTEVKDFEQMIKKAEFDAARQAKADDLKQAEVDAYNKSAIRLLSAIRNTISHCENFGEFKKMFVLFNAALPKKFCGQNGNWLTIDQHYAAMIERINKDFIEHSKTNLSLLFEAFGAETREEKTKIAEEYYRFSILKEGKNLGINMKKLRENMVDTFCPEIKGQKHDSYRKKIYTILDYLLYQLVRDSDELGMMIDELRETTTDDDKDELYQSYAEMFWESVKDRVLPFFEKFSNGYPAIPPENATANLIKKVALTSDGDPFVKLIAFLCNFWDGKEVNELLSSYIHKFESIQSFIDTLEQMGEKVTFSADLPSFNEKNYAGRIAQQLRILASIGKMKPDLKDAKRPLFKAAIEMLGIQENTDWLTNEWLEGNVLPGDTATTEEKKAVNPFRNFIANNVIESRRFIYLVRYSKPAAVRALMSNPAIVRYVLTRLPDKQIDTYYKNIASDENAPLETKINRLATRVTNFSFVSLQTNRDGIIENSSLSTSKKNVEIERLKALTGLYLTVAFVAVKNLVKTNARYFIAFSAFERDYALMAQKDKSIEDLRLSFPCKKDGKDSTGYNEIFALTEYFLKKEDENDYQSPEGQPFDKEACRKHLDSIQRHFSKKWRDIFRTNIDEAKAIQATGYLAVAVRNQAAHLNVLTLGLPNYVSQFRQGNPGMTSYFELYHFLLQNLLCGEKMLNIPEEYKEYLKRGVPCSDLIKIAYVSLGYNLPRYKNLTIEALFDKDSVSGQAKAAREKK